MVAGDNSSHCRVNPPLREIYTRVQITTENFWETPFEFLDSRNKFGEKIHRGMAKMYAIIK